MPGHKGPCLDGAVAVTPAARSEAKAIPEEGHGVARPRRPAGARTRPGAKRRSAATAKKHAHVLSRPGAVGFRDVSLLWTEEGAPAPLAGGSAPAALLPPDEGPSARPPGGPFTAGRQPPRRRRRRVWTASDARAKRARARAIAATAAFPPVVAGYWRYKLDCAEALEAEADDLPHGKLRRSLKRQATSLRSCGARVRVRRCRECDELRPGSGVITGADVVDPKTGEVMGTTFCKSRLCPSCAREAAQHIRRHLARIVEVLPPVDGFRWRMVTVTALYDPADPAASTAESLRQRIEGVKKAWRGIWKTLVKRRGAGAFAAVEMSGTGHVHLHALVYGPYLPKEAVDAAAKAAWDGAGFCHVHDLGEDGQVDEVRRAILEVGKYSAKGASPLAEEWIGGRARDLTHPTLAARFALAAHGVRLKERFGAFRAIAEEEEAAVSDEEDGAPTEAEVEQADAQVACPCCGAVGRWEWDTLPLVPWVRQCHHGGKKALAGSRWGEPRKRRKPRPPEWWELSEPPEDDPQEHEAPPDGWEAVVTWESAA